MIRIGLILCFLPISALADVVVASRTIRPQSILTPADLAIKSGEMAGVFEDAADLIGMETRVVLYAGRPVLPEDIGPPALIDRNQIVTLIYQKSGLTIQVEGRSLVRAGLGETARVMNLASKATLSGRVQPDGSVLVTH